MKHKEQAYFSERLVAFMIDGLLFTGAFFLSLKITAPQHPVMTNPDGPNAYLAWMGLWIVYHAVFSADGRATLGKKIIGLRVLSSDGKPLGLGKSLLRAIGYLPSSFFNIGFLWAFFHPKGMAWHDFLAGSRVIRLIKEGEEFSKPGVAVQSAAWGLLLFLMGTWVWQNIMAPNYYRTVAAVYGQQTLEEVAKLQEIYRERHGRYSGSLYALAKLTPDPEGYVRAVYLAVDPEKDFKIEASPKAFKIIAHARDKEATPLIVSSRY